MKKITMFLAVSAAALSGCVKENVANNSANTDKGSGIRTIRVSAGDQSRVGVNIDPTGTADTYYWKSGEEVILCEVSAGAFTGHNYHFGLDASSVGAATGTFTLVGATTPAAGTYLAVHVGNQMGNKTGLTLPAAGGTISYAIPATLSQSAGAADVADYMLLASSAPVTLAADGTIPDVTLAHKTAVVDLGVTASDAALVGATLTSVSMVAETTDQYAAQINLDATGAATAATGRTTNTVAVSDATATLGATAYHVRMVTLMDAAVAGNVTFTCTAQTSTGDIYSSDVTLPSIALNTGSVRPANLPLTSSTFLGTQPAISGKNITITSLADLKWVAMMTNNTVPNTYNGFADYTLTVANTIDMGGPSTIWTTPIGISGNAFKGTFDGGNGGSGASTGIKISNLVTSNAQGGLFNVVGGTSSTAKAQIKNVTLENPSIDAGANNTGALMGSATYADISYCTVTGLSLNQNSGAPATGYSAAGGLVGILGSSGYVNVTNCSVSGAAIGTVTPFANNNIGGVIGSIGGPNTTIDGCHFDGTITSNNHIGGIVGSNGNAAAPSVVIQNCTVGGVGTPATITASGTAANNGHSAGGIMGKIQSGTDNTFTIDNCTVTNATISGSGSAVNTNNGNAGGIAGSIISPSITTISNCKVTGCTIQALYLGYPTVTTPPGNGWPIGGIAGLAFGTHILHCTVTDTGINALNSGANSTAGNHTSGAGGICGTVASGTGTVAAYVAVNSNSTIIFACKVVNTASAPATAIIQSSGSPSQGYRLGGIVGANRAIAPATTYIGSSYCTVSLTSSGGGNAATTPIGGICGVNESSGTVVGSIVAEGCYYALGTLSHPGNTAVGAAARGPIVGLMVAGGSATFTGCLYDIATGGSTATASAPGTTAFSGVQPTGNSWNAVGSGSLGTYWAFTNPAGPWSALGDGTAANLPQLY